jgi:hypothetical protein
MVKRDFADQRVLERIARVVADDANNIHRQLANAVAVEQIGQAVIELRHQQQHLAPVRLTAQRPIHRIVRSKGGEGCFETGARRAACLLEHHAHEKTPRFGIVELRCIEDIAALIGQRPRDAGHQTWLVGAGKRQDHGITRH